ncbi:MAG: ROK family protein, partial [Bacteroidota bacterium]|nr:ROK family protein [Bacteroidota bacterium]
RPACIDNDANVAALAEAVHGRGKGFDRVFYMTVGSGIGGGLVVNGFIYHGCIPGEVEVGHLRMDKGGQILEDRCSGWAVNKKVKAFVQQQPNSLLAQLAAENKGPEAMLIKPALEKEDKDAQQIIHEVADDLAFALSHVVHLFHPDVLVIGGGLSLLNEYLRKPIEDRLTHYVMKAFLPPPPLLIALLREDVVPIGALTLAKTALYNQSETK